VNNEHQRYVANNRDRRKAFLNIEGCACSA
jgi:hypothetical protein